MGYESADKFAVPALRAVEVPRNERSGETPIPRGIDGETVEQAVALAVIARYGPELDLLAAGPATRADDGLERLQRPGEVDPVEAMQRVGLVTVTPGSTPRIWLQP
jgi:hypothetical protein